MGSPALSRWKSGSPGSLGLMVACGYMATAIALIYFNKAAFSYYAFSSPNLLTLSQMLSNLVLLALFKRAGWAHYHNFNRRNLRRLLPMGLSFIGYMVFGMISMKSVNIPMYTTLRRTGIMFVMLLEYVMLHKTSSTHVKASVGVMLLGVLVAGWRDLNFDLVSYIYVFIYNLCTALYLVIVNQLSTEEKNVPPQIRLDKYDFMYYNSLIGIPLMLCILATTGEVADFFNNPHITKPGFQLALIASSLLAFALNYLIFWNTAINSALSQTVSGQAKDVIVILLGFLMFPDAPVEAWNITGILIGFVGSIAYAVAKRYAAQPHAQGSLPLPLSASSACHSGTCRSLSHPLSAVGLHVFKQHPNPPTPSHPRSASMSLSPPVAASASASGSASGSASCSGSGSASESDVDVDVSKPLLERV